MSARPGLCGVTGASGFMGAQVLRDLSPEGDLRIRALTRSLRPSGLTVRDNIDWIQGDLTSRQDCERFVRGCDAIIHLAHTNSPLNSSHDVVADTHLNLVPTLTLLDAIRDSGRRPHLVYVSSGGGVYGAPVAERPFVETDACRPQSSYGIQKLAAENYIRHWAEKGFLTATVLRIANAYGTLLPSERLQGFIGTALDQIKKGRPVRTFGSLDNVRDYVHLRDVQTAFRAALLKREPFETYNIGSGKGTSVGGLLELFGNILGRTVEIERVDIDGAGSMPSWSVLDVSNARERLGWSPTVPLAQGVREMFVAQGLLREGAAR